MVKQVALILNPARWQRDLGPLWAWLWNGVQQWLLRLAGNHLIHTTQDGIEIAVRQGQKSNSPHDFMVRFRDPKRSGRWRTPKHIHLIVELYVKEAYNRDLTHQLRNHLLDVFSKIKPVNKFPPSLQVYQPGDEQPFKALDAVGEFSVEFMLVVSELIFIQEKTNYPTGSLTKELYEEFGVKDRFSVIQKATWRGQ